MQENDLALLIGAARSAAEIAVASWRRAPTAWDKGGGLGPVSEVDLAVNRFLHDALCTARPHYGWLSEESEDDAARLTRRSVFIVDPIDGTRAFLAGQTAWAHSLAVAEAGRVVAGIVFLPALERLYSATWGGGAHLNGRPLAASARASLDGARLLAAAATFNAVRWPGGHPVAERHFRPSLAHRLCLVAEGRFDGTLTFRDSWEWDIAAGSLIATEAGAVVTDRKGAALCFNSPRARSAGLVAACPSLQPALTRR